MGPIRPCFGVEGIIAGPGTMYIWIPFHLTYFCVYHLILLNDIQIIMGSSDYMVTQCLILKCPVYNKPNLQAKSCVLNGDQFSTDDREFLKNSCCFIIIYYGAFSNLYTVFLSAFDISITLSLPGNMAQVPKHLVHGIESVTHFYLFGTLLQVGSYGLG